MLLIAGGMPRSGTTMFNRICNAHPAVFLSTEIPAEPLQRRLLDFIRDMQSGFERLGNPDEYREREERLVAELFFAAGRNNSRLDDPRANFERASIHGHKTPSSELLFAEYEELLGRHGPRYVYCLRDPVACLQSRVRMPWKELDFDALIEKMRDSYRAFLDVRDRLGSRLFLFRLEEYAANPLSVAERVCDFLAIDRDPAKDMAALPPQNTLARLQSRDKARDRSLTSEQIAAIRNDPLIVEVTDRFVWRP